MKYLLVKADYRKVCNFKCRLMIHQTESTQQWRWSSYGNYYVHNIGQKTTYPIIPPSSPSKTAYATWSPTGNAIAFVTDNDLYVLPSAEYVIFPIFY
jgi:dipeptidyl aminopeptidase